MSETAEAPVLADLICPEPQVPISGLRRFLDVYARMVGHLRHVLYPSF